MVALAHVIENKYLIFSFTVKGADPNLALLLEQMINTLHAQTLLGPVSLLEVCLFGES
jgi:hypothetical protein